MTKFAAFLGCILGLGIALQAVPAAAQGAAAHAAATPQKSPNTTTSEATASATPSQPASPFKDPKEKISYALGLNLGNLFKKQSVEIEPALFLQGLKDALGGKPLMTDDDVHAALTDLQNNLKAKQQEKMKQQLEANKTEGDAFLAANKTKEGVVTLPSGLQYKILTAGTGPKPTLGDTVVCNYKGTLINGTEFDSSYKTGQPATFPVGGVIKGWTEALQLMPVGSKWQLVIPPDMAYGERGAGSDIGPNATLIFEVELLSIQAKQQQ